MLSIRPLTTDDVPLGMRLKTQAGWNQTAGDWLRALQLEPTGCFVGELDGAAVATLTTCVFDDVAWIAMVLCDVAYRGRGIATQMMEHALGYLAGRNVRSVRLDATALGRPVYEKFGFRVDSTVARLRRPATGDIRAAGADAAIVALDASRLDASCELDRRAAGTNRRKLIEALASSSAGAALGVIRDGRLTAFALSRPGSDATQIGPCIAESAVDGEALLQAMLCRVAQSSAMLDVPDSNLGAKQWATSNGFSQERPFFRMTLGDSINERAGEIWASFGPEKG